MSTLPITERRYPEADLQIKMAEATSKTPLESWWIASASLGVSVIAATWSVVLLTVATVRLSRFEH